MDLRLTTFPTTSSQISSHAHLPVPVISRLGLVIWPYHNLFFLSLGCCSTCIAWASRLAEASDRLIRLLDILHYQSLWGFVVGWFYHRSRFLSFLDMCLKYTIGWLGRRRNILISSVFLQKCMLWCRVYLFLRIKSVVFIISDILSWWCVCF